MRSASAWIEWRTIMKSDIIIYQNPDGNIKIDDRFKSGTSMNYFNELQERIREIRLSERFFYQKIKDIYTTSIDYEPKDEKTIEFFKVVQKIEMSLTKQEFTDCTD
jgi:hypothetical protein